MCQRSEFGNGGIGNANIIGNDCRISSLVYSTPNSGIGLGSVAASINASDRLTDITDFDSVSFTINKNVVPVYKTTPCKSMPMNIFC